jgi:4a-hydroxytetrahydrobiopterin dehydratase
MITEKMSPEQTSAHLKKLPRWELKEGKLHLELKFKDFVQAFGFMTQVAILSERANHHPEWSNVYNRLTIDLTTHEVGGISQRDFDLAKAIDKIPV